MVEESLIFNEQKSDKNTNILKQYWLARVLTSFLKCINDGLHDYDDSQIHFTEYRMFSFMPGGG
jgi:hypothetical protein